MLFISQVNFATNLENSLLYLVQIFKNTNNALSSARVIIEGYEKCKHDVNIDKVEGEIVFNKWVDFVFYYAFQTHIDISRSSSPICYETVDISRQLESHVYDPRSSLGPIACKNRWIGDFLFAKEGGNDQLVMSMVTRRS